MTPCALESIPLGPFRSFESIADIYTLLRFHTVLWLALADASHSWLTNNLLKTYYLNWPVSFE